MKFEAARTHFWSDFFVAVAVVAAWATCCQFTCYVMTFSEVLNTSLILRQNNPDFCWILPISSENNINWISRSCVIFLPKWRHYTSGGHQSLIPAVIWYADMPFCPRLWAGVFLCIFLSLYIFLCGLVLQIEIVLCENKQMLMNKHHNCDDRKKTDWPP